MKPPVSQIDVDAADTYDGRANVSCRSNEAKGIFFCERNHINPDIRTKIFERFPESDKISPISLYCGAQSAWRNTASVKYSDLVATSH